MLRVFLVLVLAATSAAQAQTSSPSPRPSPVVAATPATSQSPAASNAVAPGDPVITMKGFCGVEAAPQDPAAIHTTECLTVITRDQFDKLLDVLNTNRQPVSAATQRKLAESYVDLMLFAAAAHKDGVDKKPEFELLLNFMRTRAIADLYKHELEDKYRSATAQETEAYYQQNQASYQTLTLRRIIIPRYARSSEEQEAYTTKVTHVAQDIRERVVKGEDMAALQKEAYATLGLTATPPSTEAATLRTWMVPPASAPDVTALAVGGVSKVEQEQKAYVIYKLQSKQAMPLDQVRDEVVSGLAQQKMQDKIKEAGGSVHTTFNEQYFVPANGPVLETLH